MPNWEPNWEDVKWDHNSANQAVLALRRAANILETNIARMKQKSQEAKQEWRGRYREEFDVRFDQSLNHAHKIVYEYRSKAEEIIQKSQLAREEQKRREAERERWRLEKRAEERARLQFGGDL